MVLSRLRTPAVIAALAVAAVTMLAAVGYTTQRERAVVSTAQLVLVPTGTTDDVRTQQLQTFANSGVQGTFVEYLSSIPVPGATVDVRAVPDSRVIDVRATKAQGARAALDQVVASALRNQRRTADDWAARELAPPTAEEPAGPSPTVLLVAGVMLALLAGLATFAAVRGLLRAAAPVPVPQDEAPDGDAPGSPHAVGGAWPGPAAERPRSYAPLR